MKKLIAAAFILIIISLAALPFAYAQEPNVDVTNNAASGLPGDDNIKVNNNTVGAGQTRPANKGQNLVWNKDAVGTATFPAGHVILIGAERDYFNLGEATYQTEIRVDELGAAPSKNTEVTLISGCFVVLVPSDAKNSFQANFNGGANSVVIDPSPDGDTLVGICHIGDDFVIRRLDGNGTIQVFKGDDVIVSDVEDTVVTDDDGNVVPAPSGIGV
jgi:hypothetical protein